MREALSQKKSEQRSERGEQRVRLRKSERKLHESSTSFPTHPFRFTQYSVVVSAENLNQTNRARKVGFKSTTSMAGVGRSHEGHEKMSLIHV